MKKPKTGEPVRFKKNEVKYLACCDCNLVHAILYSVVNKDCVEVIMYRDDYLTDLERKKEREKKKK